MDKQYQDPLVVDPADGTPRGDTRPMPYRGTNSGFTGVGDDRYGAEVSQGATNRKGSAHLDPDPMDQRFPSGGGDMRATDLDPADPGVDMGNAAKSDAAADDVPAKEDAYNR